MIRQPYEKVPLPHKTGLYVTRLTFSQCQDGPSWRAGATGSFILSVLPSSSILPYLTNIPRNRPTWHLAPVPNPNSFYGTDLLLRCKCLHPMAILATEGDLFGLCDHFRRSTLTSGRGRMAGREATEQDCARGDRLRYGDVHNG